jgi:eukaryotic-like serine/threonine-protein kinase
MGRVYRVFDRAAGEERALKRMSESSAEDAAAVQAFEREYGVLTSLSHPRIIRVYDYGVDAEGRYYTMELVRGQDMRELAPMPYARACSYARDVATSLSLLHARRCGTRSLRGRSLNCRRSGVHLLCLPRVSTQPCRRSWTSWCSRSCA